MILLRHLFIFVLLSSLFGKGIKLLQKISCFHLVRVAMFTKETLKLHTEHSSIPFDLLSVKGCREMRFKNLQMKGNILNEPIL